MIVKKEIVDSFEIDSVNCTTDFCKFKRINYFDSKESNSFYAILIDKKIKLFCKLIKKILKADYKGTYASNQNQDQIVDDRRYYFVNSGGKVFLFKNNQKGILNLVPDHSDKIREFLKSSKLNPKSDADLIKIFDFINGQY